MLNRSGYEEYLRTEGSQERLDNLAELKQSVSGVKELIFDFSEVEYISSAGLRVLLAAQKVMNRQGSMKLIGVGAEVMEVFEITGFSDILTIE